MPDSRSSYLMTPQKGNLANYGKDPQHRRRDMDQPGKHSGDGDEGAPQVYVRMMVELSYDAPRPDPDGALRKECGAAIRRAVEAKLTGDGLAAQLGDATVTLRSMVMRQEDSVEAFGKPVSVTIVTGDTKVKMVSDGTLTEDDIRRAAAESIARGETKEEFLARYGANLSPELVRDPNADEARPGFGGVPVPREEIRGPLMGDGSERPRGEGGRFVAIEDDEDTAPNAGSAQ